MVYKHSFFFIAELTQFKVNCRLYMWWEPWQVCALEKVSCLNASFIVVLFLLKQITRPSQEDKTDDKNEEEKFEKSEKSEKKEDEEKEEEEKDEKEDSR